MLLLTLIVIFIGGISFAGMVEAWNRAAWEPNYPSVSPKRSFSLWSLILFLFFPKQNKFSASKPRNLKQQT
jgi:Trk-type K+ transport system membrane component